VCRWRRGDAVSSDAVTFANREATAVGKGNNSFANSLLCQQHPAKLLANPLDKAVSKEAQLCQQFSLPTAWAEAVGKAGHFSPFPLLFSSL
jgi:hypothetical protein